MEYGLTAVDFDALPGWEVEDPRDLFAPMRRCLEYIHSVKPYRGGSLGLDCEDLAAIFETAAGVAPADAGKARAFFEENFRPYLIKPNSGSGFVTAFYEPDVDVSDRPDEEFRFPFYRRPSDLIDLDDATRPSEIDPSYMFGRDVDGVIKPYFDRRDIDEGILAGRGLELAWARSRVDVFFAHVQGAARLRYPDGGVRRITYAAKAGHPFSGIGRRLIDLGEVADRDISMQAIRDWLAAHPHRLDDILWTNRSYIFFREAPVDDASLGPIAAAKTPLVAMRALAVDRAIHTFSSLIFVTSPDLRHLTNGQPFGRLMIALDTGSAIVGPARGDIFTGSGDDAGALAGCVRHAADFYILLPKSFQPDLTHGQ